MVRHELRSRDGNASLRIEINQDGVSFGLLRGASEISTGFLRGSVKFTTKAATLTSFFAVAGEASLSIRSQHSLFDVAIRDPLASSVELKMPLAPHSWYGLGHLMCQRWPLETASLDLGPFYPFDNGPNGVCTIVDPTLISTAGTVLKVNDRSRCLHIGINAEKITDANTSTMTRNWGVGVANFDRMNLPRTAASVDGDGVVRIQSRRSYDWPYVGHPWRDSSENPHLGVPELQFLIGATPDIRAAADLVLSELQRVQLAPKVPPPEKMMRDPIWTTWVRYGSEITQEKTIQFAAEIAERGLPRSVMEIDDRWSVKYGDLDFDPVKFHEPKSMVSRLHDLGFLVTLWVIPFANLDSKAVLDETTRKFFVHNHTDKQLGEFDWWQPTRVAALDLTNTDACNWFVAGLERLQTKYGIDGFKFDAGEPSFLPQDASIARTMSAPGDYTRLWIERVASKFAVSEVRSGVQGIQELTPMSRLFDRFSTWTLENGLASVLTGTLTSGILGYPFVLPDMIGGNAYGDDKPDAELMVRWAQVNVALPALQFSVAPWDMGEECHAMCTSALRWREDVFWGRVKEVIPDACVRYTPIVRPMWWVDQRPEMSKVYDQFMLGDDMLVAPIIVKGAVERTVSLPAGTWRRVQLAGVSAKHDAGSIQGGGTVRVHAALDDMPVFRRVSE